MKKLAKQSINCVDTIESYFDCYCSCSCGCVCQDSGGNYLGDYLRDINSSATAENNYTAVSARILVSMK